MNNCFFLAYLFVKRTTESFKCIFLMIPFHHIQTQCQPHITEAAKSSVEGICKKMYNLSCDYAQKVKEKNAEILKEANISGNLFYILVIQNKDFGIW